MNGNVRRAIGLSVSLLAISLFSACSSSGRKSSSAMTSSAAMNPRVERGKYLVTIGGCNDCHTPFKMTPKGPEPDMSKMLSGHPQELKLPPPPAAQGPWIWGGSATNTAFYGPWGVSYSANLTPDVHGMKPWTEAMFVTAMRTGKHFGQGAARGIQPPMPWPWYAQMSDEDLKGIYTYLQTIPAVSNVVPDWQPPGAAPAPAR